MKHERAPSRSQPYAECAAERPGLRDLAWSKFSPKAMAALVMLLGALATLWAWRLVEVRETRLVSERFANLASRFVADMQRHQGVHEQSLRAAHARHIRQETRA